MKTHAEQKREERDEKSLEPIGGGADQEMLTTQSPATTNPQKSSSQPKTNPKNPKFPRKVPSPNGQHQKIILAGLVVLAGLAAATIGTFVGHWHRLTRTPRIIIFSLITSPGSDLLVPPPLSD